MQNALTMANLRSPRSIRTGAIALALMVSALCAPAGAQTLSRKDLQETFADEFTRFDWDEAYHEAGEAKGVWRTSYRNGWDKNDINNRTLPPNKEQQVYLDKAFPNIWTAVGIHPFEIIDGGVLRITAQRATPEIQERIWGRKYTSGAISTWGSFAQRYGVFEMRAKLPAGKALWPAFWLLNEDGTFTSELDVVEMIGQKPDSILQAVHSALRSGSGTKYATVGDVTKGFHTYTMDWGPRSIEFYLDGKLIWHTPTPKDANKPMYMIVNLAVGGIWATQPDKTTPAVAHMDIDYVRVWQRPQYDPSIKRTNAIAAAPDATSGS